MTVRQLLLVLRDRHLYIWLVAALCTFATLGINLWRTKQYTATATILIDLRAPDPVQGQAMAPAPMVPGYMATQVEIISSDRVAQDVVKRLGLDKNEGAIARWKKDAEGKGTVESYYGDFLQNELEVKPSRESNLIDIKFTSPDPEFAATVANAFAKSYIDTNVSLKVDPARDYAVFFDARTKQLREQLETAQSRLSQYQRDNGIIGTDERLDVETSRLNELNTQLTTVQGQRAESQSRQQAAAEKITTSPDVVRNTVIESLSSEIARTEAKLDDLGQNVGPNHPQFIQQKAELDTLKAKLDYEMTRVANSLGAAHTVDVRREKEIREALDAQKARVLALRTQRDEVSVLQREVESAQKAFDQVSQHLSQSSMESKSQQTNVVMLSPADAPIKSSRPRIVLNTAIALFLGMVLGVGTALIVELLRPRLRGPEDVAQALALPVLITLPAGSRHPSRGRFRLPRRLKPVAA